MNSLIVCFFAFFLRAVLIFALSFGILRIQKAGDRMPQYYELVNFSTDNPVKCSMRRLGNIDEHLHDFFEMDLVLSGTCETTIDGQVYTLRTEDVISIDGHTPHAFHSSDCTLITVQFEQSLFERTLPDPKHPRFFCNSAVQGDSAAFQQLRRLIAHLVKNNADRQLGYPLRNWSLIYRLMDVMYNNFRLEESDAQVQRAHRYAARMTEISRIIAEEYQNDLTLSELADRVHLSAPYLSKFFDRQYGITFLAYLTRVRLNHATKELLQTDDTIETVSANSGFPNSHAFVQAFKKEHGILPSVYRRQARANQTKAETVVPFVEQHDYMAGLKKYLDVQETGTPVQAISCNAAVRCGKPLRRLTHTWRTMLTATSASALLLGDIQEMLRRAQKEIGFRSIKFNGILSDDMHVYNVGRDGEVEYSFIYVDKLFDFLISIGLQPFVQLSWMPEALAKQPRRLFGYLVSEPESLAAWCELVQALIRHLQARYGREAVRQWHFCVWDQPDTPSTLYGFEEPGAFYAFYQGTYNAVKECDPLLQFGAPATFYILQPGYTNWYIPFLEWAQKNSCPPDFLNFHYYDTVLNDLGSGQEAFGFAQSMTLRDSPDALRDFVNQVRSERSTLDAQTLPIYLSEWNNTPSQQDLLNDTCFKSCYIIKGILENYDLLDSFGYWSLTDWMGEAPQPREMFFGGLGLFTAGGVPKASYYAFTLLRQLGDTLLGKGEGWFITKSEDRYQILLYNYRHFSNLYAMGERFDMTFTDRYTPFSPEQMLDVHLTLRDIAPGQYLVTERYINRKAGSAFDLWVSMGAVELFEPEDIRTLQYRSVPGLNKYTAEAKDGVLELDAMLDMLEVRLITLTSLE